MNFVLFLLLNAVLLLRPEELFPAINGLSLYMILIVCCTLVSLPRLIELLSPDSLRHRPVAVCVLLYFAATIVSLCVRGRIDEALLFGIGPEFAKVILYYFLLLAVIDSPERFRIFVAALIVFIGGLSAIALANHYGVVDFPNIVPCMQGMEDPETGERYFIPRMVSSGIFNDPNDLCLILGMGILSCVYLASQSSLGVAGWLLWLSPTPLFVYALLETKSRGGLLGVLAGGTGYIFSRFGGPKSLPYAIGGAVLVVSLIGGRQGNIAGGGTAHERVMFWSDGLTNLLRAPQYSPTGLGPGWFADETGHVAHNSFVQAYVEEGFFGGGAFLGAILLGLWLLYRTGREFAAPQWVIQSRHYGFAVLVGYAMGCYSLTRNFVVPTYLALGIASVLLDRVAPTLPQRYEVDGRWFRRFVLLAFCGLILMKLMTQILGRAGV